MKRGLAVAGFIIALCLGATAAWAADSSIAGANAKHGSALIRHYGCGSCHTIPGIADARGVVGPPLTQMADRVYIAGLLRNTPDNLALWIREPQRILPGNAMPNMNIDADDARDIAAYLATLR